MAIVVWLIVALGVLLIAGERWEDDGRAPKGPPLDRDLHLWEAIVFYGGLAVVAVCLLFMGRTWLRQRREQCSHGEDADDPSG